MPLSRDYFKSKGFKEFPHITVGDLLFFELSRRRIITVGCAETHNEMLFMSKRNDIDDKITEDCICLHNYDYDGFLTEEKLEKLLSFFG